MKTKVDYLVYSDESCPLEYDGNDVMAIGFIYCPQEIKETLFHDLRQLKVKHGINSRTEIKWTKVSDKHLAFYKELIDYFYNREDVGLRILLAKGKKRLNHKKYNNGKYISWYYKMYYFLLSKVIDENYTYYMLFDQKEKETLYRINQAKKMLINHNNKYSIKKNFDFKIKQINSKESELMQLLDIFLGATTYKNRNLHNKLFNNKTKINIKDNIISYIEEKYNKLDEKTSPYETKFNLFIWEPIKD